MPYKIQVGKCNGKYTTRMTTDNKAQAGIHYQGLNVGRGYKKRLLYGKKVLHRVLPDPDFCRRR